jgi:hypothetical protein
MCREYLLASIERYLWSTQNSLGKKSNLSSQMIYRFFEHTVGVFG